MSDKKTERRVLGRGLSALMGEIGLDAGIGQPSAQGAATEGQLETPIEYLRANPKQPRTVFDDKALDELASSIREKGILQPLIVRPVTDSNARYEIVAGERRWRAAQMAGLATVPVLVRDFDDREVLEIAIIENVQREGLSPIEEANGYVQLIEQFGHTQEKVAAALGKSRSHIANVIRLLSLPKDVQSMVSSGRLSAGHARALITAADPVALAVRVVGEGLSVRETEDLARRIAHAPRQTRPRGNKDADTRALEEDLSANLGMTVVIDHRAGGEGAVTIRYKSIDQLDQLCQLLSSVR